MSLKWFSVGLLIGAVFFALMHLAPDTRAPVKPVSPTEHVVDSILESGDALSRLDYTGRQLYDDIARNYGEREAMRHLAGHACLLAVTQEER